MKRIVATFLILVCLLVTFGVNAEKNIFTGYAHIALDEAHNLTGVKYPCEPVDILGHQNLKGNAYIRGLLDNGIVRDKAIMPWNDLVGVKVRISICPAQLERVKKIVQDKVGADLDIDAEAIIAATLYGDDEYVGHMFMLPTQNRIWVGSVSFEFNPGEHADLYIAQFWGDGSWDIGFAPGWRQCTPAPKCVWICVTPKPRPPRRPTCKPCN